jgi:hypothetical protein
MLTRIINPTSGMIRMKPDIKISMVFQQILPYHQRLRGSRSSVTCQSNL